MVAAHRRSEAAEDLGVRQALPGRLDCRLVPGHVVVPVSGGNVDVLGPCGCGQDDVGEISRVGEPVLGDDQEQVVTREARADPRLVGRRGGRVRVHDDHRFDGRIVGCGERLSQA